MTDCFPEVEIPQKKYLSPVASLDAELEGFVCAANSLFSLYYRESDSAFEHTKCLLISLCASLFDQWLP